MSQYLLIGATALCASLAYAADVGDKPDPKLGHYLSPYGPASATEVRKMAARKPLNRPQAMALGSSNTYTYLRCYYGTGTPTKPTGNYVWGLEPTSGDYYRINGSWWSGGVFDWKNMFYSDVSQDALKAACQDTLAKKGINKPVVMYAAADNALSFNYTVWSNDGAMQGNRINRIVAFGDSLSDTHNMYNASQWLLPNRNSWMLGRFSNGYNWVEYLSDKLHLPLYNWAVGGAGVNTEKFVISGVTDQVQSWKQYMQRAANYRPENTLFTVMVGGNDFVNYNRSVDQVIAGEKVALQNMLNAGARNILLLKLPDVSRAPVFKYRTEADRNATHGRVLDFNNRLAELASSLEAQYGGSAKIRVFDTYGLFNSVISNPSQYGVTNTADSCLNIGSDSSLAYLSAQTPRSGCTNPDTYLFWDALHPTTHTHKVLAEKVGAFVNSNFTLIP
ncbi:SGNH/GDSL hydrolase family protein [Chitinimonas arctica]|uniref:SGNH/GDSL hydrolase family protein n=1 Tax=Chitinimonas arctica TaxID=2594795 RepID=A0A516SG57_9NEIS|nr:SGNH/GDSL hydrolase family protein [Chitinimonas arctica]QDQ27141.1 SGNH/GDSL hydrolase family protein [Chitinimonas arctica]